jgi:hypothetical protein
MSCQRPVKCARLDGLSLSRRVIDAQITTGGSLARDSYGQRAYNKNFTWAKCKKNQMCFAFSHHQSKNNFAFFKMSGGAFGLFDNAHTQSHALSMKAEATQVSSATFITFGSVGAMGASYSVQPPPPAPPPPCTRIACNKKTV